MDFETEYMRVSLPAEYPYVMLVAGLVAFEVILMGFFGPGRIRGKIFNQHFMEQNFGSQIMGDPVLKRDNFDELKSGYPDMGNGTYADKLTYEDWVKFAKAQRGHLNMLETVTIVVFLVLVTGLEFPMTACALGSIYGLFRPLYFMQNRLFGFVPGVVCLFALSGTSMYTCY